MMWCAEDERRAKMDDDCALGLRRPPNLLEFSGRYKVKYIQ